MKWAKKDKNMLKKIYPAYMRGIISRQKMMKLFNRTMSSIWSQATRLGLTGQSYSILDEKECKDLVKNLKL